MIRRPCPPFASLLLLGGCATLGGTVRGDFACRAPTGNCAPLGAIDEAALREMAGREKGGPPESPPARPLRIGRDEAPGRTAERVLTIIFPAHVDRWGVLHDQATAHAVVEAPRWRAPGPTTSDQTASRSPRPLSLREAIAGASAPPIEGLEPLPTRAPPGSDSAGPPPPPSPPRAPDTGSGRAHRTARAGRRSERGARSVQLGASRACPRSSSQSRIARPTARRAPRIRSGRRIRAREPVIPQPL